MRTSGRTTGGGLVTFVPEHNQLTDQHNGLILLFLYYPVDEEIQYKLWLWLYRLLLLLLLVLLLLLLLLLLLTYNTNYTITNYSQGEGQRETERERERKINKQTKAPNNNRENWG